MQEPISFCPDPYVRYTKWAARYVLGLRKAMSISDVARFTGLHWETVKNIEKAWLEKRYRKIRLGEVEYLGIDEVHLGRVFGFITVVRDLDSGAVLFVGKGKGGEPFGKRLKRRAKPIKAVAIDMANSYRAWVAEVLPDADIVCGVHNWDYQIRTGISSYNSEERLEKFSSGIDGDEVWVDEDEVARQRRIDAATYTIAELLRNGTTTFMN